MMMQGIMLLRLHWFPPLSTLRRSYATSITAASSLETPTTSTSTAAVQLTGRERRQLRQESRESRAGTGNWREEVEDRLLYKPKKHKASWTEELNLDRLALPGPQWWVVRVSRVSANDTGERMARALARNFPDFEFKVYFPAVPDTKKLKNGSYSTKPKPLFPGCIFLHCILNKEIHDFIRECAGVGGFLGSRVGNTKRQINKPKPVPFVDMEVIFKQVKEAQEKHNQTLKEEQEVNAKEEQEVNATSNVDSPDVVKSIGDAKPKRRSKKSSKPTSLKTVKTGKSLAPGARVRVLSGPFTEFAGQLKELDEKKGKATVGFVLFGKESFVDVGADQIVLETA